MKELGEGAKGEGPFPLPQTPTPNPEKGKVGRIGVPVVL